MYDAVVRDAIAAGSLGLLGGLGVRFGIPNVEWLSVDLLGYGGDAQLE